MLGSVAGVDHQALLAAYRTLGLGTRASAVAVRLRFHELAERHHDHERTRQIDAAYDLVKDAPLEHQEIANEPTVGETPVAIPTNSRRRITIDGHAIVRFWFGMGAGWALAYWLGLRELMQHTWPAWSLSVAMGIVFARTSSIARLQIEAIVSCLQYLPRR